MKITTHPWHHASSAIFFKGHCGSSLVCLRPARWHVAWRLHRFIWHPACDTQWGIVRHAASRICYQRNPTSSISHINQRDEISPSQSAPSPDPCVAADIPVLRFWAILEWRIPARILKPCYERNPNCPIKYDDRHGWYNVTTVCPLHPWDVVNSPFLRHAYITEWLHHPLSPQTWHHVLNKISDCVQPGDRTSTASDSLHPQDAFFL